MRSFRILFLIACVGFGATAWAALNNLQGSVSATSIYETAAGGNTTAVVTLTLQTDVNYGTGVDIKIVPQGNGSVDAVPGLDFTAPTDLKLALLGDVAGVRTYRGTFTIAALADNIIEPNERISLLTYVRLQSSAAYQVQVTLREFSPRPLITIRTNSGNAFNSNSVNEGGGTTSFILERSVTLNDIVTVYLQLSGTAANGADYIQVPNTITFAKGEATKTITISPIEDAQYEGTETIHFSIYQVGTTPQYDVAPSAGDGQSVMLSAELIDNEPVPTPTPAPTPTVTPSPTPAPTPTPDPDEQTGLHPAQVIGLYPPKKVMFSRDGTACFAGHGPLLTTFNGSVLAHKLEMNNAQFRRPYVNGEKFEQYGVEDFDIAFNNETGVLTFGNRAALWDLKQRVIKRMFNHNGGLVSAVAYQTLTYPNRVATGDDRIIRIWDADTATLLRSIPNETPGRVRKLAFSPNGRYLFVGVGPLQNSISFARVFSVESGGLLYEAAFAPNVAVLDGAWAPDSSRFIYGVENGRITVVQTSDFREIYRFNSTSPVNAVAYSQDGTRFVTQWNDVLRVWDANTFQQIIAGPIDSTPRSITISPDNQRVAVAYADKVSVYESKVSEEPGAVPALAEYNFFGTYDWREGKFTEQFGLVVVRREQAEEDNKLFAAYDFLTGEFVYSFVPVPTPHGNIPSIFSGPFDLDRRLLDDPLGPPQMVTLTNDGVTTQYLTMYDLYSGEFAKKDGKTTLSLSLPSLGSVNYTSIAINPAGTSYVVGAEVSPYVSVYATDQDSTVPQRVYDSLHNDRITAVRFKRNNFDVASVGEDAKLLVEDAIVTSPTKAFFDHDLFTQELTSVDVNQGPGPSEILTASGNQVFWWDDVSFRLVNRTAIARGPARYIRNTNDQYILANSTASNAAVILDKATKQVVARYVSIVSDKATDRNFDVNPSGQVFSSRGGRWEATGIDTIWIWPVILSNQPQSTGDRNAAQGWAMYN